MNEVWWWSRLNNGAYAEADYPYTAGDGAYPTDDGTYLQKLETCRGNIGSAAAPTVKATSFGTLTDADNVAEMRSQLYNDGPATITVMASNDNFMFYAGGII